MTKKIIEMDSSNNDTRYKADKALMILNDLFQRYNFTGERATKQEAEMLSFEAEKIICYIGIAIDYVSDIKSALKKGAEDLDVLFDEAKRMEGGQVNG